MAKRELPIIDTGSFDLLPLHDRKSLLRHVKRTKRLERSFKLERRAYEALAAEYKKRIEEIDHLRKKNAESAANATSLFDECVRLRDADSRAQDLDAKLDAARADAAILAEENRALKRDKAAMQSVIENCRSSAQADVERLETVNDDLIKRISRLEEALDDERQTHRDARMWIEALKWTISASARAQGG